MAQTLYTMEAAQLVCGDTGPEGTPGLQTFLRIRELKLPAIEENYVDHLPGGAPVAIEVNTNFNKLEATFTLAGWNPDVDGMIAPQDIQHQTFTAYGLVRDRRSGRALQAVAVMQGRLARSNPTAYRRGDILVEEYAIKGIVHYQLAMSLSPGASPTEIYYWDFFTSAFRVTTDGYSRNVNEDMIIALAIPPGV